MSFVESGDAFVSLDIAMVASCTLIWLLYRLFSHSRRRTVRVDAAPPVDDENEKLSWWRRLTARIRSCDALYCVIIVGIVVSTMLQVASAVLWTQMKYHPTESGLVQLTNQHNRIVIPSIPTNGSAINPDLPGSKALSLKKDDVAMAVMKTTVADMCGTVAEGLDLTILFLVAAWLMRCVFLDLGWILVGPNTSGKLWRLKLEKMTTQGAYFWYIMWGALAWAGILAVSLVFGTRSVPFGIDSTLPNNTAVIDANHSIWFRLLLLRGIYTALSLYGALVLLRCRSHMRLKYLGASGTATPGPQSPRGYSLSSDVHPTNFVSTIESSQPAQPLGPGTPQYRIARRTVKLIALFAVMRIASALALGALSYNIFTLWQSSSGSSVPAPEVGWEEYLVAICIKIRSTLLMLSVVALLEIVLGSATLVEQSPSASGVNLRSLSRKKKQKQTTSPAADNVAASAVMSGSSAESDADDDETVESTFNDWQTVDAKHAHRHLVDPSVISHTQTGTMKSASNFSLFSGASSMFARVSPFGRPNHNKRKSPPSTTRFHAAQPYPEVARDIFSRRQKPAQVRAKPVHKRPELMSAAGNSIYPIVESSPRQQTNNVHQPVPPPRVAQQQAFNYIPAPMHSSATMTPSEKGYRYNFSEYSESDSIDMGMRHMRS